MGGRGGLLWFGCFFYGVWAPPIARHWLKDSCARIMGWPSTALDPGQVGSQITAAYLPLILPGGKSVLHTLQTPMGLYSEQSEWLRAVGSRVSGEWVVSCRWIWLDLLNKSAGHHGLGQKQTFLLTCSQEGYLVGGALSTRTLWGRKLTEYPQSLKSLSLWFH